MQTTTIASPSVAEARAGRSSDVFAVTDDITGQRLIMVNVYYVGVPSAGTSDWVLVDTGLPFCAGSILHTAERLFGSAPPRAIILTHGHFDHVGSLHSLLQHWNVPVYAHEMELPYLTGRSAYPPPDPTVGGGFLARASILYPKKPINIPSIQPLPADGSIPFMPGWRWIFTPGHSPGHVSLFRDSDRTLIAGDAFVTTRQESLLAVITQRKEIHGPPMYFTPDWPSARDSVRRLAQLRPAQAATGHGYPMSNPELDNALESLARHFDQLARPRHGRYVNAPALSDETGVLAVPPPVFDPVTTLAAIGAVLAAGVTVAAAIRKRS